MAFADFLINGSPQSDLGLDVLAGDTLVLQLASAPALDSARVAYSVVIASLKAPDVVFDPPDGRPLVPTGQVKVLMPAKGVHSYLFQCEVNEGRNARGQLDPEFTRQRLVGIRSPLAGLRKMVPAESTQYDARGWSDEQNREVDQVEEALGSIGGNILAGDGLTKLGSTFDIKATDGSILVAPDSVGVGVLQTDAQHGPRGGGLLHALADAIDAGFLSPGHFTLLAGATSSALAKTLALRGGASEVEFGSVRIGAGGPDLVSDAGAAKIKSANGVLTTIGSAGPQGGSAKLVDEVTGSAKTSDASPAPVVAYTLPDACIALVRAEVLARSAATGNSGVYERKLGVKRHGGGSATPVGNVQPIGADGENVPAWDATIVVAGKDVVVLVTGALATDIEWFARMAITLYAP